MSWPGKFKSFAEMMYFLGFKDAEPPRLLTDEEMRSINAPVGPMPKDWLDPLRLLFKEQRRRDSMS